MFGDFDQYILGYFLGSFLVIMKVGIFKLMNMLVEQVKIKKIFSVWEFWFMRFKVQKYGKIKRLD